MSQTNPVIVVIEDDPQIRRFLRTGLHAHGFEIHEAETGKHGLIVAGTRKPDLIILDLGLPDMDGVDVIKKLREWTSRPVIILSARNMEVDKVAALDAGADDYLTKPFGFDELLARIRVALRHAAHPGLDADSIFKSGSVRVDLAQRRVYRGDEEIHLTPIEYRLLTTLIKHSGKVLTHRQLLTEVWGPGYVEHSHYLRIYMGTLRHKLEADPARPKLLLTEAGTGYRLVADVPPAASASMH
jgi:two-component system KDP operon response regulator KdpE